MKILIVDDEKIIREGVANGYDWGCLGITTILKARDGNDALALALKHRPQIIISDICIPKRTGLEFSGAVLKKLPDTQIILLSGYGEFQYAHEAIQIGVVEYLLKPATIEQIVGAVEKALSNIRTNAQKRLMEQQLENYKPMIRNKFLNDLIEGNASAERLDSDSENDIFLNLRIPRSSLVVLVFSIDTFDDSKGWQYPQDYRLLKYAIMNITSELLSAWHSGVVFDDRNEQIVMILHEGSEDNKPESVNAFAKECIGKINAALGVTITIGIGSVCDDISGIAVSYKQALQAVKHKIVMGRNKIIRIDELRHINNKHFYPEHIESKLFAAVDATDKECVIRCIHELLECFKNADICTPDYIRNICIGLLFILQRKTAELDIVEEGRNNGPDYWNRELERTETIGEMESFMIKEFCYHMDNIVLKLFNGSKGIALKAKKYIDDNLDGDVSLTAVASHVHLSNSYFANLFKQEVGETFSNYLSKTRVEVAKRLLKGTELRIHEIGEKIGFELGYFSQFFKFHTGMAPSDYRKR